MVKTSRGWTGRRGRMRGKRSCRTPIKPPVAPDGVTGICDPVRATAGKDSIRASPDARPGRRGAPVPYELEVRRRGATAGGCQRRQQAVDKQSSCRTCGSVGRWARPSAGLAVGTGGTSQRSYFDDVSLTTSPASSMVTRTSRFRRRPPGRDTSFSKVRT